MTCTICIAREGSKVVISNLAVDNADFAAVIASQPEQKREQTTLDVIAVGSAAMRRVQTTLDIDLVEKRFGTLAVAFERSLGSFEKQALETLSKRFSPTETGSYTKFIADLLGTARKDVEGWTTELAKSSKDLLDPDKKSSAVARLEEITSGAAEQFANMFDPDVKGSYASILNEKLAAIFGGDGRAGVLAVSLKEAIQPILAEIQTLKEKLEGRKAAEQIIAASTLKGRPFEEEVQGRLSTLAQPFGDDVVAVGSGNGGCRAGDFLVTVNGSGRRLVVEARDRKQISLPAIKTELERQRTEREADVALYVSSGQEMLPQHVGDFQVYGDIVVTTVDNLRIAYRIGRVMAMAHAPKGVLDQSALRTVISKVRDGAASMRNVKTKASQIRKLTDGIHSDVESLESRLGGLLDEAEKLLGGGTQA